MTESHKQGSRLRDVILGGQDGLVNVLGIVLGASAATSSARVIISVGLAATFAESLAMGAVAYTSFMAEKEHYDSELAREKREMREMPEKEREEVREIYLKKGFRGDLLERVVDQICSDEAVWLDVMMTDELGLKPIETRGVVKSALLVCASSVIGSLVPLAPYFFLPLSCSLGLALALSTLVLFLMGYYKGRMTEGSPWRAAVELALIGMCAAFAGYFISLAVNRAVLP